MTMITDLFPTEQPRPVAAAPKAAGATTIAAAALAVLVGLSAADIHWGDAPDTSWDRDGLQLDGRGKWAGYLKP